MRLSSPAEHKSKLLTGEKAIPEQTLVWAMNLYLRAEGIFLLGTVSIEPPMMVCRSQIQTVPDSYAEAKTCLLVWLNFTIVNGDF